MTLAEHLNEVDTLKLALFRETNARLTSELLRLQGELRALTAQHNTHQHAYEAFARELRNTYQLAPGDQLHESGTIKRTTVRAIKEASHE
jgi:hypothetical protein